MNNALPKPAPAAIRAALGGPNSCGTTLAVALLAAYGLPALDWTPETIRMELRDDQRVVLDDAQFGRLMAAIVLLTSDRFYSNLPDFIALANALNGESYDPDLFDPVDVLEAAWAVAEAAMLEKLVLAPAEGQGTYSGDVAAYIRMAMEEEGLMAPPAVLKGLDPGDDRRGRLLADYSSDPAMTSAIVSAEDAKADNIDGEVRARMSQLIGQLAGLFGLTPRDFLREARLH